MNAMDNNITTGLERMNALFGFWGMPKSQGNGDMEAQMKRLETFASDLQKIYAEGYSRQMQALFTANERLLHSLQEFARCRQPRDLVVAESKILATLLEGASLRTKTWAELSQKVEDRCAALAHEIVTEVGKNPQEAASTTPSVEPVPQAARQSGKQQARA